MKVVLNKGEVNQISKFIKGRGVSYADVNAEMTDHISLEVEEVMTSNKVSFSEAVEKVFLRYDRFYFMKIEEQQVKNLEKQSWVSFKNGLIGFFSFPKILFTFCLFFCCYRLAKLDLIEYVGYLYIISSIVLAGLLFYFKIKLLGRGRYLRLTKYHWVFIVAVNFGMQPMLRMESFNEHSSPIVSSSLSAIVLMLLFIAVELYMKEFKKIKKQYA